MSAIDLQRQFYDMLMRSQYWAPDRMQEHQRSQLGQLLRHARANVPFYADRLDAVLRPDGDVDWARWGEVPILTRADLREQRDAMQARELPAGHGPVAERHTSGSSGQPVAITETHLAAMAASAAAARAYGWHGVDPSGTLLYLYGDDAEHGAWPDGLELGQWGPSALPEAASGRRFELNLAATPEQQVEYLERKRPAYIAGLTTRVSVLALEALRRGVQVPVRTILTHGEAVTASDRALFREAFGAEALAAYSTEETNKIAYACAKGGRYHINAELMLLELLDTDGQPVLPGEAGRVVVTPFYATAQPLIRYEVGDMAVAGSCDCGCSLPVLDRIVGRIVHMFQLPDGRSLLPYVSEDDIARLGARIWQLAQTGPRRVAFRYVPGAASTAQESWFTERLRTSLHADFDLVVQQVDDFPRRAGRKHIHYAREWQAD